jgi:hypothetical protein
MATVEDRLVELLHRAAAGQVDGVSFDDVARRARGRRSVAAASAVTAAALVAGAVIGGIALTGHGQDRLALPRNRQQPTGSLHHRVVFQGIVFKLPNRWTTVRLGCGWPANHTVVINNHTSRFLGCSYIPPPTPRPTSVTLSTIYGPRYALGWAGQRIKWQGQPAWLAVQARQGVTTDTLTLPWLNATVAAESPDPVRARALLSHVLVRPGSGLDVPRGASSVFIQSLAGRDGNGPQRDATITTASDVHRLLADLRSLDPINSPRRACDGSWWPDTVLLTMNGSNGRPRTYAAQFGSCGEVIAGTGAAAAASNRLLADVRLLVPNSGF